MSKRRHQDQIESVLEESDMNEFEEYLYDDFPQTYDPLANDCNVNGDKCYEMCDDESFDFSEIDEYGSILEDEKQNCDPFESSDESDECDFEDDTDFDSDFASDADTGDTDTEDNLASCLKDFSSNSIWKWCDLDGHPHDRSVSLHELFPIRAPLMSLEHCIAPFLESCDPDDDHRITLQEWGKCLQLDEGDMEYRCEEIGKAIE